MEIHTSAHISGGILALGARYFPKRFDQSMLVGETRVYSLTWPTEIKDSGLPITGASVAVSPSGSREMQVLSLDVDSEGATVKVSNPQRRVYTLLFTVVLGGGPPDGLKYEYVWEIVVDPRRPGERPPPTKNDEFGSVFNWTPAPAFTPFTLVVTGVI